MPALLQNPEGQIRKIAKFLGKDIDEALVSAISDKCNFTKLKQAHENKNDAVKDKIKGGTAFFYRKGLSICFLAYNEACTLINLIYTLCKRMNYR